MYAKCAKPWIYVHTWDLEQIFWPHTRTHETYLFIRMEIHSVCFGRFGGWEHWVMSACWNDFLRNAAWPVPLKQLSFHATFIPHRYFLHSFTGILQCSSKAHLLHLHRHLVPLLFRLLHLFYGYLNPSLFVHSSNTSDKCVTMPKQICSIVEKIFETNPDVSFIYILQSKKNRLGIFQSFTNNVMATDIKVSIWLAYLANSSYI